MERVQFQQEQMLAELKDLVDKKLFTPQETKIIMKKRTEFERALVRRVAKKSDFLRYAAYEMGLEQLRRRRKERLGIEKGATTISDYALVRRRFEIFERALRKFKADVGLWVEYVRAARREGARTLVGRITARALQLHPNVPALYILAASHELEHASPTSARALLQRGLRLNAESEELWRAYVRMELGFVESLRRRWDVLGIRLRPAAAGAAMGKGAAAMEAEIEREHQAGLAEQEGQGESEKPTSGAGEGARMAAQKEILQGAIVKSALASAVAACPRWEFVRSLYGIVREHPSPQALRESLLGYLDGLLRRTLPHHPEGLRFIAARLATGGAELVDGLKDATELLMEETRGAGEDVLAVFAEFVSEWLGREIDDNVKEYLLKCLELIVRRHKRSPSVLAAHVTALARTVDADEGRSARVRRLAEKYTGRVPRARAVWMARLGAVKACGLRALEGGGSDVEE